MKTAPLNTKIVLENSRALLLPFENARKSELKKLFLIMIFGAIWG